MSSHDRNRNRVRPLAFWLLVVLVVVASPALADVDLLCPLCEDGPPVVPLSASALVDLLLTTMLQKGISLLLAAALAVVGLPWLIAGTAIAALYVPTRVKARLQRRS